MPSGPAGVNWRSRPPSWRTCTAPTCPNGRTITSGDRTSPTTSATGWATASSRPTTRAPTTSARRSPGSWRWTTRRRSCRKAAGGQASTSNDGVNGPVPGGVCSGHEPPDRRPWVPVRRHGAGADGRPRWKRGRVSTLAAPVPSPGPAALGGNDRLLAGLVLGVMSFWLFAQTMLNVAPVVGADLGVGAGAMNTAGALTSLFAGIFAVVMGGLADGVGRVRITRIGFGLGITGALLVALTPEGALAAPVLLSGRALQGLSAACIMPASLALLKAGWDGAGRQRAVSMWSI